MNEEFIKAMREVLRLAELANKVGSTQDRRIAFNAIELVTKFVNTAEESRNGN